MSRQLLEDGQAEILYYATTVEVTAKKRQLSSHTIASRFPLDHDNNNQGLLDTGELL